jgi:hypothetical protein
MRQSDFLELIESEWSIEADGFSWQLRQGAFSDVAFRRVLEKLAVISLDKDALLPRRFVSVLWYMPLFMQWQFQRIGSKCDGNQEKYNQSVNLVTNEIERILGVP